MDGVRELQLICCDRRSQNPHPNVAKSATLGWGTLGIASEAKLFYGFGDVVFLEETDGGDARCAGF